MISMKKSRKMERGKRHIFAAAGALIIMAAVVILMSTPNFICFPSGISERFYNLIDDDCDGEVDEDYSVSLVSRCGNGRLEFGEFCDDGNLRNLDGCSSDCKAESPDTIYVASYVGNIDGDYSDDWFHMYDRITDFHDKNGIPSGFSIYPASIRGGSFGRRFAKIYNSPYIEFVQKANSGEGMEPRMDELSFDVVSGIILNGRENFIEGASQILDTENVSFPVAYNQPQGRFTETIRDALRALNFTIFFEMYVNDDLAPVKSTEDFDVLQYGAGFDFDGMAGRETVYRQPQEIIEEIKNYDRADIDLLLIHGRLVVPIWCHQSDFEDRVRDSEVDENKWRIYTTTLLTLKQDPNIVLVTPSQIYEMRH